MKSSRLRLVRIIIACVVFLLFTIIFADVFGIIPRPAKHVLAGTQFVPSSLSLFSGLLAGTVAIAILVVTLFFGRVYCSMLCPLGIWQDVVRRIGMFFRKKQKPLPARPAKRWLRYGILAGVFVAGFFGWGATALTLLDPYSNFGRIGMQIFRPIVVALNNFVASVCGALDVAAPARIPFPWAGLAVFGLVFAFFLAVSIMAALRGRLFCNTICPVGTFLGLASKFAPFRVKMISSKCAKCGACFRACKAQCIDLKTGTIDAERCVACYDCVGVCQEGAISMSRKASSFPNRKKSAETGAPSEKKSVENLPRRKFLAATAVGIGAIAAEKFFSGTELIAGTQERKRDGKHGSNSAPVAFPPGGRSLEHFLATCTGCQLCVSVCSGKVLEPALFEYNSLKGVFKPRLNFEKSFCNYGCTRCSKICPDGALLPLSKADKKLVRLGHAVFKKDNCIILRDGTACGACAEHCPTAALQIVVQEDGVPAYPKINKPVCIGCGACEYACPALPEKAIFVKPFAVHGIAKPLVEEQVDAPVPVDAFPF